MWRGLGKHEVGTGNGEGQSPGDKAGKDSYREEREPEQTLSRQEQEASLGLDGRWENSE